MIWDDQVTTPTQTLCVISGYRHPMADLLLRDAGYVIVYTTAQTTGTSFWSTPMAEPCLPPAVKDPNDPRRWFDCFRTPPPAVPVPAGAIVRPGRRPQARSCIIQVRQQKRRLSLQRIRASW